MDPVSSDFDALRTFVALGMSDRLDPGNVFADAAQLHPLFPPQILVHELADSE